MSMDDTRRVADARPARRDPIRFILIFAVVLAFYRGFRRPNVWSSYYYEIGMFDEIFRRSLAGTFLQPLGCQRFNINVVAIVQVLVMAAGLFLLLRQAVKAKLEVYLAVFFLSQAGDFMFNEIGYIDQLLYLAVPAGVLFMTRGRYVASTVMAVLALLTHEIAIVVVLPLFLLATLLIDDDRTGRRVLVLVSACIVVFGVQTLFFQTYPSTVLARYSARRAACGFPDVRPDFVKIFTLSYNDRFQMYFTYTELLFAVVPLLGTAAVVAVLFTRRLRFRVVRGVTVFTAGAAPLVLGFAGWDTQRWFALSFLNLVIILILLHRLQPKHATVFLRSGWALAGFVTIAVCLPHDYLDFLAPRPLTVPGLHSFVRYVTHDILTAPPR